MSILKTDRKFRPARIVYILYPGKKRVGYFYGIPWFIISQLSFRLMPITGLKRIKLLIINNPRLEPGVINNSDSLVYSSK